MAAAAARYAKFLSGLRAYQNHPYRRPSDPSRTVWGMGASRVSAHGPTEAGVPSVLLVPSMINRSYVLDLTPTRSLVRYLTGRGVRSYVFDWGAPGKAEQNLDLDDFILGRLAPAFDAVVADAGGQVSLAGYCMGGLLTLALGVRQPAGLAGLALLATPWDFHAERGEQARATATEMAKWLPAFEQWGGLPVDAIQALFASLDPLLAYKKFSHFADLDPTSSEAEHFVALEDWLNDGVDLPAKVARTCLIGWYGDNDPAREAWQVGGQPVRPRDLTEPALTIVPETDRIVPPGSARALAARLPEVRNLSAAAGHIGMMTGTRAEAECWAPLADWILRVGRHG